MIIGSGFIATAFQQQYADCKDICIYAAGVSNSMCTDLAEFERDKILLTKSLRDCESVKKFIYISTCSIQDPSMNSMYVDHKKKMEEIVTSHRNSLIISLPQIAGINKNPYTLLNAFYNAIVKRQAITVMKNVYRNIIDIDDVVSIVSEILPKIGTLKKINIANPSSILVLEIVREFEKVLSEKANLHITNGGVPFYIDIATMSAMVNLDKYRFNQDYLRAVLKKYYKSSS